MNLKHGISMVALLAGCADQPPVTPPDPPPALVFCQWFHACARAMAQRRQIVLTQWVAEGVVHWHHGSRVIPVDVGREAFLGCDQEPASDGVDSAPWLFVGYGRTIPAMGVDDYTGADVKGKTVVMLAGMPVEADEHWVDSAQALDSSGQYREENDQAKLSEAWHRGAAVVVMVVADEEWSTRRRFAEVITAADELQERHGLTVSITETAWRKSLHRAGLHADPIKSQAASTTFRAVPMPLQTRAQWVCHARRLTVALPAAAAGTADNKRLFLP